MVATTFRYSPVAAYLFVALRFVDPAIWRVLHVAGGLALPTWPMRLLLLASWPFAFDLQLGNLMTFILLAGVVWGLRGNRPAALIFLGLALLAPLPLVLPVAAWLFWKQPGLRSPFVVMFVVHAGLVLVSGWGDEWIERLLTSIDEIGSAFNCRAYRPDRRLVVRHRDPAECLALLARLGWPGRAGCHALRLPYYLILAPLRPPDVQAMRPKRPRP